MDKRRLLSVAAAFCALVALSALLLLLLEGKGAGSGVSAAPSLVEVPTAAATATPSAALATAEDVRPDPEAFYRVYTGALTGADGVKHDLAELSAAGCALFFYNSWCPDCESWIAQWDTLAAAVEAGGIPVYPVCRTDVRGETTETALAVWAGRDIEALTDPGAALYGQLGLKQVPSLVFLRESALWYATSELLTADQLTAYARYTREPGEKQALAFIVDHLIAEDGGVASEYTLRADGSVKRGKAVLSESQGMLMLYAARAGDQALFDRLYGYVRAHTRDGLTSWRVEDGKESDANAFLDDLRIVEALLQDSRYPEDARARADALLTRCVEGVTPCDYAALNGSGRADTIALCYLDPATFARLSELDERWQPVYERAVALLENGRISDAFPLYWASFSRTLNDYTDGALHISEAMNTLYHLARAGMLTERTREYLLQRLRAGNLPATFTVRGGVPEGRDYPSTAACALLCMAAREAGDDALCRMALYRMERMRVFDASSPLDGVYCVADATESQYTFDLLTACLAWQAR